MVLPQRVLNSVSSWRCISFCIVPRMVSVSNDAPHCVTHAVTLSQLSLPTATFQRLAARARKQQSNTILQYSDAVNSASTTMQHGYV